MTVLGFELEAGGELRRVGTPADGHRLLATATQADDRAEVVVTALRAQALPAVPTYHHAGNGAFDVYQGQGPDDHAVEVKLRITPLASDNQAWARKHTQMNNAEKENRILDPECEQIVTDEAGFKTVLLVPGLIVRPRMFAPSRAKRPAALSVQIARFAAERLQLLGGAVLLEGIPAGAYACWERGEEIDREWLDKYRENLARYRADPEMQDMAKKATIRDRQKVSEEVMYYAEKIARHEIEVGLDNSLSRLFLKADRGKQAEAQRLQLEQQYRIAAQHAQESDRAAERLAAKNELYARLVAALQANDPAAAQQLQAELAAFDAGQPPPTATP